MGEWEVRLFGGLRVARPGGRAVKFRTRATEAVFAYLALHPGVEIPRETLASLTWPDADSESARRSLRSALSSLRQTLGERCFEADRRTVRMVPEFFSIDVSAFRDSHCPSLYTGRLLEGLDWPWVIQASVELEESYFRGVIEQLDARPVAEALQLASAALERDPSRLDLRAKLRELDGSQPALDAPFAATTFVGREREVGEVRRLLERNRLITLTGPGGCGKSRLAGEIWRRLQPESWFVPLADVRDPLAVGEEIRLALRVPGSPSRPAIDQAAFALGDVSGVLVLDNFEQVLEARADVQRLLVACPNLRLLVTSQVLLGIPHELEYPVGPLALEPSGGQSLPDSQQLFVERAKAVNPSFVLNERNAKTIALLCERLDGYALALEIAAAKSRVMTPQEMLEELRDRFAFLTRGSPGLCRHRSLRTALDWSFERLPVEAQDLLSELTVFRGSFNLKTVVAVCGRPSALATIQLLAAHAWIERASTEQPTRFRLLESVREYASELLPPKRMGELAASHASHFLKLADRCIEATFTADEPEIQRQVESDLHNLDAAWEWLCQNDPEGALRLVSGLNWFWTLRGLWSLAEERMRHAIELVDKTPRPLLNHGYQILGNVLLFQGRLQEALHWYQDALETAEAIDHTLFRGHALIQLAQVHAELGEYEVATHEVKAGIHELLQDGNPNWIGAGYVIGCLVANRRGDALDGIEMGLLAVEFCRKGGYRWGLASALNELAMAYHLVGNFEGSLRRQEEAIAIKRTLQTPRSLALSLADAAATEFALGKLGECRSRLAECMGILGNLQGKAMFPSVYLTAARLFDLEGDLSAARICLEAGDALIRGLGTNHAHHQIDAATRQRIETAPMIVNDPMPAAAVLIESL